MSAGARVSRAWWTLVCAGLLLGVPMDVAAQTGAVTLGRNLDFEIVEPQGRFAGWDGSRAVVREEGCRHGRCPEITTGELSQRMPAMLLRARIVILRGWLRADDQADDAITLGLTLESRSAVATMHPTVADGARDGAWTRFTAIAEVDRAADALVIVVRLNALRSARIDDVTLDVLEPGGESQESLALERAYARLNGALSNATPPVESLLLASSESLRTRTPFPFSRVDLSRLASGPSNAQITTTMERIVTAREDVAVVDSTATVDRTSTAALYRYRATYRDMWFRSDGEWRLLDTKPSSVTDISPPGRGSTANGDFPTDWVPCGIVGRDGMTLGPSATASRFVRSTGAVKALMLFTTFSDSPVNPDPRSLHEQLAVPLEQWFSTRSRGRLALSVTSSRQLHLVSGSAYIPAPLQTMSHIAEALRKARDAEGLDSSQYDLVYIVAMRGLTRHSTFAYSPENGINFRGRTLYNFVAFDYVTTRYPRLSTLVHETLHVMGVPDLYVGNEAYSNSTFVGSWDVMSALEDEPRLTAWVLAKLGWLERSQVRCATTEVTETLTPVGSPDGLKAIAVPTSPNTAVVVELRERVRDDIGICEEGVIIYDIDATVRYPFNDSRRVPMRVTRPADLPDEIVPCGFASRAPMSTRTGRRAFVSSDGAVKVEVLSDTLGGSVVKVTPTLATPVSSSRIRRDVAALRPGEPERVDSWRACVDGSGRTCNALGIAYQYRETPDLERAADFYERACELKEGAACVNLGSFVEAGVAGFVRDFPRAKALYAQGCALGSQRGCDNK